MGLVFLALGLLLVAMRLLTLLPWLQTRPAAKTKAEDKALIAALAVALARASAQSSKPVAPRDSNLGATLATGESKWAVAGRTLQLHQHAGRF